jgi:hypothetical protein
MGAVEEIDVRRPGGRLNRREKSPQKLPCPLEASDSLLTPKWRCYLSKSSLLNKENTTFFYVMSSSKLKGVDWHKPNKKWRAQIRKDGKVRHLGYFQTPEEAHLAYEEASDKDIRRESPSISFPPTQQTKIEDSTCRVLILAVLSDAIHSYIYYPRYVKNYGPQHDTLIKKASEASEFLFSDDFRLDWGDWTISPEELLREASMDLPWVRERIRKKLQDCRCPVCMKKEIKSPHNPLVDGPLRRVKSESLL